MSLDKRLREVAFTSTPRLDGDNSPHIKGIELTTDALLLLNTTDFAESSKEILTHSS